MGILCCFLFFKLLIAFISEERIRESTAFASPHFFGEVRIPSLSPATNWHKAEEAGARITQFPKKIDYPVGPARWHALCQVYRRSLEGLSGGRGDGGCVDRRKN